MPQYAAVDIGSNSVRLLVADVTVTTSGLAIRRLSEDRQVTRLGESVFRDGAISTEAMADATGVLQRMRAMWQRYEIAGIRVVATSATRDASNQAEFVEKASAAIGASVETISGQEEARLIQVGVQSVWPHPQERILIVDVGGGSAELILAENGKMSAAFSRPLGAVRLQEAFLKDDPPTPTQLSQLREFIAEKLTVTLSRLGGRRYDRAIATSASAAALVASAHRIARSRRESADRLKVTRPQLRRLFEDLASKPVEERRRVAGIGPRRAEIIIPGAAVFLSIIETFALSSLYYCAAGVRDGIVADLAQRRVGQERATLTAEQRAVVRSMARKFGVDAQHARRLAEFALQLFASLEPLHHLPPYFAKLLEAACYLCDIGHYISDTSHHKHSQYIVANADLAGFTESERNFISLLCRYHRKALPTARHSEFQSLSVEARRALLLLIPILRIADGLDRSGDQHVESVSCAIENGSVMLTLRSSAGTALEEWAMERVAEPFRSIYSRDLAISVVNR
jgi:exopolyphosphatase/guanosine-5'-triphosphate,3'-diphosphate pyrophosphatase